MNLHETQFQGWISSANHNHRLAAYQDHGFRFMYETIFSENNGGARHGCQRKNPKVSVSSPKLR